MILQILARCGAFFIGFIVKGQMNHDFAFGIEVNPCVIEITIGKNTIGFAGIILVTIQCFIMILSIYSTEKALKKHFNDDGKPR